MIFLALYGALRRADKGAMAIATTYGLVGTAVYFASNQAFAMLSLSDQYAALITDAQQAMNLAAGQALGAAGVFRQDDLDSSFTSHLGLGGAVDGAMSPTTEPRNQLLSFDGLSAEIWNVYVFPCCAPV